MHESSAAWSYATPKAAFVVVKDHLAFCAAPSEPCAGEDERVTPQPGGVYGGWIARRKAGPFKGAPDGRLW